MNVKTFISETLRQIVEGIHEAQTADGGTTVNTRLVSGTPGGHLVHDGRNMFTQVDFDIAISAETSGGGKGSLRVWIASAEGGGEQKAKALTASGSLFPFSFPMQATPRNNGSNRDEVIGQLQEQLSFLRTSSEAYDEGKIEESMARDMIIGATSYPTKARPRRRCRLRSTLANAPRKRSNLGYPKSIAIPRTFSSARYFCV